MLTAGQFWLVVKALITILPVVINAVRDGRIRADAYDDVVDALVDAHNVRVARAKAAANAALVPEEEDPNAR